MAWRPLPPVSEGSCHLCLRAWGTIMTPETTFATREEWLALRRKNVGASEVAALFGAQPPYAMSHYALWQAKAGRIPEPDAGGERPRWGLLLEEAIMAGAAERNGWKHYRRCGYVYHPTVAGMGCSPDFVLLDGPSGAPIAAVEAKNADWLIHRRQWGDEPPLHILLQAQHQMACTGLGICHVVALVGGNDLHCYPIERRPSIIAEIERRVAAFWQSIRDGKEPPVDGSESTAAAVAALYPHDDGDDEPADLSADNELPDLCANLLQAGALRRQYEAAEREAKSNILVKIGPHRAAVCNGFRLSAPETKATPARVITEADVGNVVKGRAGFRRLTVKEMTA